MKDKIIELIMKFERWNFKRKLWKAVDLLASCGQYNGNCQSYLNQAKNRIYDTINVYNQEK